MYVRTYLHTAGRDKVAIYIAVQRGTSTVGGRLGIRSACVPMDSLRAVCRELTVMM